jgi:23S rRNA (adenine2503-C2)-methyltransferase
VTQTEATLRPDLYDLAPSALHGALHGVISPDFRIDQIRGWLHQKGVSSFDEMTNLPKDLRASLAEQFAIAVPAIVSTTEPAPDGSQKVLFRLEDGALIEAVTMPMGQRTTLCLSSQAGCAVGCTFCVTGFYGEGRNLRPSEMLAEYNAIRREKRIATERLNIVFMGMGEPLLNFDHLLTTLEALNEAIALRRITVSTAGIIPGIEALAKLERRPNLAVSINAPDRERREEIMPITRKYPLEDLIGALRRFPLEKARVITAEYVLLAGFNDAPSDAAALAKLLRGIRCKVNAIPFNSDPNLPSWMQRPSDGAIDRFVEALVRNGVDVTVRRSKGRDIAAACGQLRGQTERRRPGR